MSRRRDGLRILITGGNGFIGSNLARRLLNEGAQVSVIARPGSDPWRLRDIADSLNIYWADIADPAAVYKTISHTTPDLVFHTAMQHGHPRNTQERCTMLHVSVVGTFAVLEACSQVGVSRMVHLGSSTEYRPSRRAMGENLPLRPNTFRGTAKALASHLISYYARVHRLPAVVLRPFSVYGPWEAPHRFIPRLLAAALTDREIPLTGPNFRHDFVFIADVVEALLASSVAPLRPGQAINIGSGHEYTNQEVADLLSELVGRPLKLRVGEHPPSPTDRPHWVADISLAEKLLGFRPAFTLREGLKIHLEWMRGHLGM